ncbi:coenzyme F420-0:L-glutamate ligase [candidate division WWE3 bacterium]|nr:coenzyme F420-0:L-glutamate ligase [candidate division WWE3 bacterium]
MLIKTSTIQVNGKTYERLAIKTHLISAKDNISEVAKNYTQGLLRPGDLLVISERAVAVTQGRSFLLKDIKPSFLARHLYKFVTGNPGGIGLRSPHTMELALREAGLARIVLGALCSVVTKPFGMKGVFYKIVGHGVNAIDGPCDYTLYPGNISAKLGPKHPEEVASRLADELKIAVAIIDANDLGRRVEGASKGVNAKFVEEVFRDNPLGQRDEQTPLALVREVV